MNQRTRAQIRTNEVEQPQSRTLDMPSSLSNDELDRSDIAIVTDESLDSPIVKEYIKDLSFMEDVLTIVVGETTDPNAENPVASGVNGEVKLFTRGIEYKVKRKFVESLIKVEERVKTVQYKDDDGLDQTRIDRIPALKYPISIISDPAGATGRRWFQHQCKNAW